VGLMTRESQADVYSMTMLLQVALAPPCHIGFTLLE